MIDKKGYDSLMAQIAKELKVDEKEIDKKLNDKYGNKKYIGKTAKEDRGRESKKQAEEKKQEMARRKRIRERVHFTQFGGKKKVLKEILRRDFKDTGKKPESLEKSKTISVSKTDAKKSNPELIIHSGGSKAERIKAIKSKLDKVQGAGSSFNEKSKSLNHPKR